MTGYAPLVLVVEDNDIVRKIAMLNLQKLGVEIHTAENGLEAIELFKTNAYDLVLMDIAMPEMNGLEATRIIRKAEIKSGKRVPIVAISAGGSREESLKAGMDDHIAKPADYERVLRQWIPWWFTGVRA